MFETLAKLPIPVLVVSVLYSFAALGIAVAVIVAAIMRWSEVRPHFRPGLRLAALAASASAPSRGGSASRRALSATWRSTSRR